MKITFVMASGFSLAGGDRVIAVYAERLQRRGHEVFVISRPRRQPSFREQVRSVVRGQGWLPGVAREPSHFDYVDVSRRLLDRYRPVTDADVPDADVVIATWWETAEWVECLSPSKGVKVYFVQGHEVFDYLPKERVAATYLLRMHKIVVAPWLAELVAARYGDKNASLVMNGVDTEQFEAPLRGKQARPTVGMLYSTAPVKGCDISLKAFSLAASEIPQLRMVAFGTEKPSDELPLPAGTQYVRQPAQNALKDIYAQCDVWVCGSRTEGFHLPPLEAMACRCPVVSTHVGGPQDIVKDGENGYLAPVGDPVALADHLVRVLTLPEAEWRAMSDAAYATATRYTWDDATERFEAALRTALARCKHGEVLQHASSA